ncbi:MAG: NAD-dependent epimerase/dehydratase family protein [Betaproteobacteria bacterium]
MAFPTDRVLVTGARGFTGRHLCARLASLGADVVGLVETDPGAHEIACDLRDPHAVAAAVKDAAPDRVVHLAGIASVEHGDAAALYRTNVLGTLALLDALAAQGRGRGGVVLASTARVYGERESGALDETATPAPTSHYAASKLAMEHMAAQFRAALPIVVTRPFNYTGPGQREPYVVPKIVRHFAARAAAIELGNVDVVRDFQDVRVVVEAYVRLLTCPAAAGQAVNLCSGNGYAIGEIVGELERQTGHRMAIRVNPAFVRPNEPQRLVGSPARQVALIGPLPAIPLATTLADMLAAAIAAAR